MPTERTIARTTERPLYLSDGALTGLVFMHHYRFLTVPQFARISTLSLSHAYAVLRRLHNRGALGYIGYFVIPGEGRAPKVYYLARRGFELLAAHSGLSPSDLGPFRDLKRELAWTPQMYHRLDLLDSLISLECAVRALPHLRLIKTLLEYRRAPGTQIRETADYVCDPANTPDRIVPDAAFILENRATERRGLFFLEQDTGSEQITYPRQAHERATIVHKFVQYDTYLAHGRFAETYKQYGDFRFATVLLITTAAARVENIRRAAARLSPDLHRFHRLATQEQVMRDFLGPVWQSRNPGDPSSYSLITRP